MSAGKKVVVIGGSDAHSHQMHLGLLKRTIFPYEFHFRGINNHVIIPQPLGTDAASDSSMILEALRQGHSYIGYDLPAPTRGFRFTRGFEATAQMGDELSSRWSYYPDPPAQDSQCILLKDGNPVPEKT
jgi:hypothetical protein